MSPDESLNDFLGARDVFDGGLVRVRRNGRGIVLVPVEARSGLDVRVGPGRGAGRPRWVRPG